MDLSRVFLNSKYDGFMTLSDIHGELSPLLSAVKYARKHNLLIVTLGDLIDGHGGWPFECVELVLSLLDTGEGVAVIGNHCDKHYRRALGNPIKMGKEVMDTLHDVGTNRLAKFDDMLKRYITHTNSDYYAYFGNVIMCHGGVMPEMWDYPTFIGKELRSRCIYGETDGTRESNGLYKRTYQWSKAVPRGCIAVIGHDRVAKNKPAKKPAIYTNKSGGKVIFSDTGCGKELNFPLTGCVFSVKKEKPRFVKFKQFT